MRRFCGRCSTSFRGLGGPRCSITAGRTCWQEPLCWAYSRSRIVRLHHRGANATILGVHFARPRNRARLETQRAELQSLLDFARQHSEETMLWIGDFNATPWSSFVHDAYDQQSFRLAAGDSAWSPTWPGGTRRYFGVPIDFALIRGGAATMRMGPPIGSDHRPIAVSVWR
ncbi:MAG: endonuclease/exonuclease/phosphatase family protein [Planctomycetota bacterium]